MVLFVPRERAASMRKQEKQNIDVSGAHVSYASREPINAAEKN